MSKLTFDEALERLNDERPVSSSEVYACALDRVIWIAEWHCPGCLSESVSYSTSKEDAVESACFFAGDECDVPRGMKTALRKFGFFQHKTELFGYVNTTVSKASLGDLL